MPSWGAGQVIAQFAHAARNAGSPVDEWEPTVGQEDAYSGAEAL